MELKDIKVQSGPMSFFNKENVKGSAGFDFLSLVNDKKAGFADKSLPVAEDKAVETFPKAQIRSDQVNKDQKAEQPDFSDKKEAKRKDKNLADNNDRKEKIKPAEKRKSGNDDAVAVVAAPVADEKIAKPTIVEEAKPIETVQTNDSSVNIALPNNIDTGFAEAFISLEDLSQLDSLLFFNPQTNSVEILTGEMLAAKVSSGEISQVLASQIIPLPQDSDLADFIGEEIVLDDVTIEDLVANPKDTISKLLDQKSEPAHQEFVEKLVSSDLADQSVEMAKIIGEDNKVKINVSVEEENFSYTSQSNLVKNITEVGNNPKNEVLSNKPSEQSSLPIDQSLQNPVNDQIAAVNPMGAQAELSVASSNNVTAPIIEGNNNILAAAPINHQLVNDSKLQGTDFKSHVEDAYKGMSKEVIDQVKVNITKSAVKGIDKIEISLKPEDLGKIEIKMQISKDGKLQAQIVASRPETLDILQKDAQILQKAFDDAGLQTDENSLTFAYQNENQDNDDSLRRFKGDLFENGADNDNLADAYDEQHWDGKSGLNIKV